MWAFAGMGFIISVGYMDPGNWATDITAGSSSGYVLLVAVLLASITAMFLQASQWLAPLQNSPMALTNIDGSHRHQSLTDGSLPACTRAQPDGGWSW